MFAILLVLRSKRADRRATSDSSRILELEMRKRANLEGDIYIFKRNFSSNAAQKSRVRTCLPGYRCSSLRRDWFRRSWSFKVFSLPQESAVSPIRVEES